MVRFTIASEVGALTSASEGQQQRSFLLFYLTALNFCQLVNLSTN